MAKDVPDLVREVLISAIENVGKAPKEVAGGSKRKLPGIKGLAVGAGALALAPVALRNLDRISNGLEGLSAGGIGEKLREIIDEAGDSSGQDDDGGDGGLGVGEGRRMPVQQSVDIGAPVEVVYNQWTQFEEWPKFMHRVVRVNQEDDCTVSFATKIWGKTKEFTAEIETQRPDERVKWRATKGMNHVGVVTFHELAPNLTRVLLSLDVDPGGPLEKAARGLRHIKRAARGDLHRFKAFIELSERETGAWRGVIENGEVAEPHDSGYDEKREYVDADAVLEGKAEDKPAEKKARRSGGGQRSSGRGGSGSRSSRRSSSSSGSSSGGRTRGRSASASSSRSRGSANGHGSRGR